MPRFAVVISLPSAAHITQDTSTAFHRPILNSWTGRVYLLPSSRPASELLLPVLAVRQFFGLLGMGAPQWLGRYCSLSLLDMGAFQTLQMEPMTLSNRFEI